MKKKRETLPLDPPASKAPDAILEQAAIALEAARPKKGGCIICGEESAPISSEGLCWVCRRLKFSAWRDTDSQISAQE